MPLRRTEMLHSLGTIGLVLIIVYRDANDGFGEHLVGDQSAIRF